MAKLGVIHYPFPKLTLSEFLSYAARTGFGYVELQIGDVWKDADASSNPEANAASVKREMDGLKLKASALAAGNDFILLEEEAVKRQVERMKRVVGLAQVLGASCIRTEGGSPKDAVPQARWAEAIAGCLERLVPTAEKTKVGLAVDNHGYVTNAEGVLAEVFRRVECPLIGANLDTMNWRWFGHDLETVKRCWDAVISRTLHTHLKDGVGARAEYKGMALGEGELDLAYAVKGLKKAGYKGVWCAEYEGAEGSEVGYAKCLKWMKKNV